MKFLSHIFICLLLCDQGVMLPFNNRCSPLCRCLYSKSCFRLQYIEQRADSTYWIDKNNKPIKNFGVNNSVTSPEETISVLLLHIWKTTNETAKTSPLFHLFEELIITPRLGWYTEPGSARSRQFLALAPSAVISSKWRREAIKFKTWSLRWENELEQNLKQMIILFKG